ncbi:MAG: hypothetical protein ABI624_04290 [Casimicrobiaceae bacterium]
MPTARELLEQADALMRRNRASIDDDIPVLTDAVPSAQEAQSRFVPMARPVEDSPSAADADDEVPVLTDAVEEIEAAALVPEVGEGEPSDWLNFHEGEPSVIGDAPNSIAIVPVVELHRPEPVPDVDEFDGLDEELAAAIAAAPREEDTLQPATASVPAEPPEVPFTEPPAPLVHAPATPVAPVVVPVALSDAAHWEAMAEEIRMQVLQRIDLFTDTGLRTQLGERLQPIVDRASADLIATINSHVGELLRAYVAEAIEREIESWRRNH